MVLCITCVMEQAKEILASAPTEMEWPQLLQHKIIIRPKSFPCCLPALPPSLALLPHWQRTRSWAGWRVMVFPRQSSSAVLLASQGNMYLPKIKAASCIMSGGGELTLALLQWWEQTSEVQREGLQELDYRWRVFLLGIRSLDLQAKGLRCFGGRIGAHQTAKAHLLLYILASFAEFWICL